MRGVEADLLLALLRKEATFAGLSAADWEAVLTRALSSALVPALRAKAEKEGCRNLPLAAKRQFAAARVLVSHNRRQLLWEVNRIALALRDVPGPVILLKGAAYHARGLPLAAARYASDVDIMVPKDNLAAVEAALKESGWESVKENPYDERYYRQWMHELPPFRHKERGTYLDVHHTILPESGRLGPDAARLFADAEALEGGKLATLAPADMVLHAIVHWIQDGDLNGRLRDLVDIHEMLTDFATRPGFWDQLLEGARAHGFQRPLYYALVFSRQMMATPIPEHVLEEMFQHRPPAIVDRLMRFLVPRAVMIDPLSGAAWDMKAARFLLFVRSHWLRMPPFTLARHLGRKAYMRLSRQA